MSDCVWTGVADKTWWHNLMFTKNTYHKILDVKLSCDMIILFGLGPTKGSLADIPVIVPVTWLIRLHLELFFTLSSFPIWKQFSFFTRFLVLFLLFSDMSETVDLPLRKHSVFLQQEKRRWCESFFFFSNWGSVGPTTNFKIKFYTIISVCFSCVCFPSVCRKSWPHGAGLSWRWRRPRVWSLFDQIHHSAAEWKPQIYCEGAKENKLVFLFSHSI